MAPGHIMSDIEATKCERDIIQKYDLDMEGCEDWDVNRWEDYEGNIWNLRDELKGRYDQIFPSLYEDLETEEDKEEREKWEEEEEEARQEYFKNLEEWEANNPKTGDKEEVAIYYSDEEEDEEGETLSDSGTEEKEDPTETKSKDTLYISIPQDPVIQPDPGGPDAVESTNEMEENEASGEYTSVQVNRRLEEENDGKNIRHRSGQQDSTQQ